MSAKLLHSLSDENPDLHRQIGCMSTIFQLFDRHHLLGGRRIGGHNHKRLPPPGQTANHGRGLNSATKKSMEKNQEVVREKQRLSTESSRTSFSSSSCSSTFSSVDCNKTAQAVPFSSGQSIYLETPTRVSAGKSQISSLYSGRQSPDFRDVVKDSMNREVSVLSVKTTGREERVGHVMKHIDSPRPLQSSRSDQSRVNGFDRSIRVLSKLREAPKNPKNQNDGSLSLAPKDTPRFSYDGMESLEALRARIKLKELPRLSLDSREGSLRSCASESRSNFLINDLQRMHENPAKVQNSHQEPGSNKRPSSVVARLMGLEAFPGTASSIEVQIMHNRPCPGEDSDRRSSRTDDESKQHQVSGSPRVSRKDPASPRLRDATPETKIASGSKYPLEPAPWRHPDCGHGSQKPAAKNKETPRKAPHVSTSVYGEIEKRLTELEFRKSGKDLRALKQILEAMHKTRETSENKNEDQASVLSPHFESQKSKCSPICQSSDQGRKSARWQNQQNNHPVSPTIQGTSSPKRFQSPIVVIKPAKLIEKTKVSCSPVIPCDDMPGLRKLRIRESADKRKQLVDKQVAKDLTPRSNYLRDASSQTSPSMDKKTNGRTSKLPQTSKTSQTMTKEHLSSPGTDSPRLQQKTPGIEKQSHATTTSPDSGRARRQFGKQPIESGSPSRKLKTKSTKLQQHDSQQSDISSETRDFDNQNDTASMLSESNISWASQIDTEVSSTESSREINSLYQQKGNQDKNNATRLSEGRSIELAPTVPEQPSPISVLDTTFYGEESLSPVKKTLCAFKADDTLTSNEAEWHQVDLNHLPNATKDSLSSDFNHKNLDTVKHLVRKLRQLNSTPDEASMNHIASLCWGTNPDHRYITEILLASGFLKDLRANLTAIHPCSSGLLINPNLFHVLEQAKASSEFTNEQKIIIPPTSKEKVNRKLIFDAVNEILSNIFSFLKLRGRSMSWQKLLNELCSEIDRCQTYSHCSPDDEDSKLKRIFGADTMHQFEDWADYSSELPGLVLDIERLIFKDLITEVVSSETAEQPRRHCRQLFSK